MNYKKDKKGFTLMELVVAIAVIVIALTTSIALISFSVSSISTGKYRISATILAQEGLEIVRNIRDSNWLKYKRAVDNWRDDLGEGDWRVQYDQVNLLGFSSAPLRINVNGFYQYDTGDNTLFERKITIEHIDSNQIKVVSEVTWQEKGRSHVVAAEDRLYNWLEE